MDEAPANDRVAAKLKAGERIVWRQKPSAKDIIGGELFRFVFLAVFVGIFVYCAIGAGGALLKQMDEAGGFDLFGFFGIVVLGFYLFVAGISAPQLYWSLLVLLGAGSTHYALTNKYFLVVNRFTFYEYPLTMFNKMEADEKRRTIAYDWGEIRGGKFSRTRTTFRATLFGVEQPTHVASLIRRRFH